MSDSDRFIKVPENLDYRGSEFYDMEEDLVSSESAGLFEELDKTDNRYSDITEIASGGMKRIYRAYDQKTDRYIALARLKENDDKFHGPFLAEARMNAALQHPNIIKVHEIDFDENRQPYFTMDLKIGDTLGDIIKLVSKGNSEYTAKYSLDEMLAIFLKVCDAVSYSHSQGILHLDIKPENIQVGEHGEVLLCDWGLARYTGDSAVSSDTFLDSDYLAGVTVHGKVRGTPGYMAPELITDKKKRCEQTDIYSLGALLYSILTFKRPMDGDLDSILQQTAYGKVVPPKERTPYLNIPASLDAVVMKSMASDIKSRYSSVNELVNDVRKYTFGYSTSAENAGFVKEVSLFFNRNRLVCTVVAGAIMIIAVFTVVFIRNLEDSRQQEILLRQKAEKAEKDAVENLKRYMEEKEMTDLSLSSDPTSVLFKIKEDYHKNFLFDPVGTVDETLKKLERIKEVNSDEILLYEFKGDIHFLRQEFDLAMAELMKGRGRRQNINQFRALERVKDHKSNNKPASVEVMLKVIKTLQNKMAQQQIRMLLYDRQFRNNPEEHILLVEAVLKSMNKIKTLEEFNYEPETGTLTVRGNCHTFNDFFLTYDRHLSVFCSIELNHLILSGMERLKVSTLQGLNLKSLDLREMRFTEPDQIIGKGITEKLILTEDLVEPAILEKLRENTKVIFAE